MRMSQQDFKAAIASLEKSSSTIYRQIDALKAQRQYLASIKRPRVDEDDGSRTKRLAIQNLTLAVGRMPRISFSSYDFSAGRGKQSSTHFAASGA